MKQQWRTANDTLKLAAKLLREHAKQIRLGHTDKSGKWDPNDREDWMIEAKRCHDELLAVGKELSDIAPGAVSLSGIAMKATKRPLKKGKRYYACLLTEVVCNGDGTFIIGEPFHKGGTVSIHDEAVFE